jgi:hypothetical protein
MARSERTRRRWPRWLRRDGVPEYELIEVSQLGDLILRRILNSSSLADDIYGPWVASRVTYPLRSMLLQASRNTRGAVLLNLLVVGGGFATSGIAVATKSGGKASALTSWVVFAIGLVVAVGGALTQFFRPAFRATERTALSVELREEGWAFATSSAGYQGAVDDVFPIFEAKVSDIHRRAAKVGALDSSPTVDRSSAATRGSGRRRGGGGAPPSTGAGGQ